MIRLFLTHLLLCQEDFEREDVEFWASFLEEGQGAMNVCWEIMAYRESKRRLRKSRAGNPENVVAVLLYNASRTGTRDPQVAGKWEEKLDTGFSLDNVSRLDQAMTLLEELRGAYLSEKQVGLLLGRTVNLDRVTELIIEEYEKLAGGEACES